MKCACGAELEPAARFCGACGSRLPGDGGSAAAAPKGAPPASAAPSAGLATGGKVGSAAASVVGQAAPRDPYLGTVLNNRFSIESKLGEGGFGAVYRGVQLATQRKVALKLLHPEMARDKNLVARFRREGLLLCNLRDAHTITTYDFDQTGDGTLYIAMELLEGRSLHEVFAAEAPIAWQRMCKIMAEMCSSLAEAHSQGIVHRDLKPENIYLESRPGNPEFVKILDFGIAKVVHGDGVFDDKQPQLTATGQTLGTLEYMSPEQLMGKALDGRSDVYALGVLAYELITGQLPFPDAQGPAALITAQIRKVPPPLSQVRPDRQIPPGVDGLVLRMLNKDKTARFDDVDAVRAAVEELLLSGGAAFAGAAHPAEAVAAGRALSYPPGAAGAPGSGAPIAGPPGAAAAPPFQAPAPQGGVQPVGGAAMHASGAGLVPPPAYDPGAQRGRGGPSTQAALAATRPKNTKWILIGLAAIGALVGLGLALSI